MRRVPPLHRFARCRDRNDGKQYPAANDHSQRRLFLLGMAFMARGMTPDDAYDKAMYYIYGPRRGQNWVSVLADQDRDNHEAAK
jgi:hypothetical protein